jgi:hypothetical protein
MFFVNHINEHQPNIKRTIAPVLYIYLSRNAQTFHKGYDFLPVLKFHLVCAHHRVENNL